MPIPGFYNITHKSLKVDIVKYLMAVDTVHPNVFALNKIFIYLVCNYYILLHNNTFII